MKSSVDVGCSFSLSISFSFLYIMLQAFQIDKNAAKFHQLTGQIEAALSMIPYERLDISEEVREQVRFPAVTYEVKRILFCFV